MARPARGLAGAAGSPADDLLARPDDTVSSIARLLGVSQPVHDRHVRPRTRRRRRVRPAGAQADMGILIAMAEPATGVLDAVDHGGAYTLPVNGQTFPRTR